MTSSYHIPSGKLYSTLIREWEWIRQMCLALLWKNVDLVDLLKLSWVHEGVPGLMLRNHSLEDHDIIQWFIFSICGVELNKMKHNEKQWKCECIEDRKDTIFCEIYFVCMRQNFVIMQTIFLIRCFSFKTLKITF